MVMLLLACIQNWKISKDLVHRFQIHCSYSIFRISETLILINAVSKSPIPAPNIKTSSGPASNRPLSVAMELTYTKSPLCDLSSSGYLERIIGTKGCLLSKNKMKGSYPESLTL
eukprot:NODE_319_length_9908_cov_1.288001.p11 type:complete len:114 gc:universal NODE_319_length_9908_cov_1.288001:4506-4847(+)